MGVHGAKCPFSLSLFFHNLLPFACLFYLFLLILLKIQLINTFRKPALNWTCSQIGNSNSACDRIQSLEPFYATQYYAYDDQQYDQQYNQGYYTEDNDDYTEENTHYQLRQNIF